jgi:hypothetical protein
MQPTQVAKGSEWHVGNAADRKHLKPNIVLMKLMNLPVKLNFNRLMPFQVSWTGKASV